MTDDRDARLEALTRDPGDPPRLRELLELYAASVQALRKDVTATAERVAAARTAIDDARKAFEAGRDVPPA